MNEYTLLTKTLQDKQLLEDGSYFAPKKHINTEDLWGEMTNEELER
jgi:hypothetical protein